MTSRKNPGRTRSALLEAAYQEIYRHGFQAASLDRILTAAGVTKGALYHHFKNKREMAYAVIDEIIAPFVERTWIRPIQTQGNPIDHLISVTRSASPVEGSDLYLLGCPLGNLALEMASIDDQFRDKVVSLFDRWRSTVGSCLEQGKLRGEVRGSIDPQRAAGFYVAVVEGMIGLTMTDRNTQTYTSAGGELIRYLESLRVA